MADQQITEAAKNVADVAAIGTAVGTLAGWLPHIAALFTVIWTGIRIFESDTVQRLLGRRP